MSRAIEELDELIEEVRKLQIRPVFNTHIHNKDDLIQELENIKCTIEEDIEYKNEMDEFTGEFLKSNYFRIDNDESDGREEYYDLSFGDDFNRVEIYCHKNHLKDLLQELSGENFDYFSDCNICNKDINIGDEYYNLRGGHVHKKCINEYLEIAGEE